MKTTFIYCLREPDTGSIRYVGKSDNPKKRLSSHLSEARDKNCHRKVWLHSLKSRGLRPVLEIVDEVPVEHWQQLEVAYIEFFKACGFDLTNNAAGGGGVCDPSPEVRERQRMCRLGKKLSTETRAKMSAAHKGENHPMYGKHQSDESKTKITAKKIGVKTVRNRSGFVGVSWDGINQQWKPHLCVATKRLHLGRFDKLEDAVFVHALAVDKYFFKNFLTNGLILRTIY